MLRRVRVCTAYRGTTLRKIASPSREASVFVQGAANVMDGDIVTELWLEGDFAWVRDAAGAQGFLKREYLHELPTVLSWASVTGSHAGSIQLRKTATNSRAADAFIDCGTLVRDGDTVAVLRRESGEATEFAWVRTGGGVEGYMKCQYLRDTSIGGIWRSDSGVTESGQYFVTEVGHTVLWLGLGKDGAWSHAFLGQREGDVVRGTWADIPVGQMKYQLKVSGGGQPAQDWEPYHGKLAVRVNPDRTMQKIEAESTQFGCTRWRPAQDVTALPELAAAALKCGPVAGAGLTGVYDNEEMDGMYFLTQVGDRVFWFGQSTRNGKDAHVAVGTLRSSGAELDMTWADVPNTQISGQLTLTVDEIAGTMQKVEDPGRMFAVRGWQKRLTPEQSERARARVADFVRSTYADKTIKGTPTWNATHHTGGLMISVSGLEGGDAKCAQLCALLPLVAHTLTLLRLNRNNLTDESAPAIVAVLPQLTALQELEMYDNGLMSTDSKAAITAAAPSGCIVSFVGKVNSVTHSGGAAPAGGSAGLPASGGAPSPLPTPSLPEGDPYAAELGALKTSALKKRALALGATADQMDEVDDADDSKAAAVALMLSLRCALEATKVSALKKQLRGRGATDEQMDEIDDADDSKAAAVRLMLQLASGSAAAAGGAASPVPAAAASAAASEPEPAYTVETHGQTVEVVQTTDEFDFVFSNKTASDTLCLTIRAKLTERGLHVWQQKTNIPKDSDNWFNEWFPSAVKSRKIVCFISVDYLKSPYCMKEFGIALATHKLLVVACEPLAQINAIDPSVYPYASNALAYLLGGGQVIFHDSEDVVAEIIKFA
jgi:hypothetical protein